MITHTQTTGDRDSVQTISTKFELFIATSYWLPTGYRPVVTERNCAQTAPSNLKADQPN